MKRQLLVAGMVALLAGVSVGADNTEPRDDAAQLRRIINTISAPLPRLKADPSTKEVNAYFQATQTLNAALAELHQRNNVPDDLIPDLVRLLPCPDVHMLNEMCLSRIGERARPALREAAKNQDPIIRASAIYILASQSGGDLALAEAGIKDESVVVRRRSLDALAALRTLDAASMIRSREARTRVAEQTVKDAEPSVRIQACEIIGHLEVPLSDPTKAALLACAQDSVGDVRIAAFEAIRLQAEDFTDVLERVKMLRPRTLLEVRPAHQAAVDAIQSAPAVPTKILYRLRDGDSADVRRDAASRAAAKGVAGLPFLIDLGRLAASDKDEEVRKTASAAFSRIASESAAKAQQEVFTNDSSPWSDALKRPRLRNQVVDELIAACAAVDIKSSLRSETATLIARIIEKHHAEPQVSRVVRAMQFCLTGDEPQRAALRAIAMHGGPDTTRLLADAILNDNEFAAFAKRLIDDGTSIGVATLEKMLETTSGVNRTQTLVNLETVRTLGARARANVMDGSGSRVAYSSTLMSVIVRRVNFSEPEIRIAAINAMPAVVGWPDPDAPYRWRSAGRDGGRLGPASETATAVTALRPLLNSSTTGIAAAATVSLNQISPESIAAASSPMATPTTPRAVAPIVIAPAYARPAAAAPALPPPASTLGASAREASTQSRPGWLGVHSPKTFAAGLLGIGIMIAAGVYYWIRDFRLSQIATAQPAGASPPKPV